MDLNQKVRAYIEDNLVVFEDEAEFTDEDNIFKLGFVNSLFAMKLLTFVENEFKVTLENDEIDIENFSSINNIVNLVQGKLN